VFAADMRAGQIELLTTRSPFTVSEIATGAVMRQFPR
jgi:hypothetical protein